MCTNVSSGFEAQQRRIYKSYGHYYHPRGVVHHHQPMSPWVRARLILSSWSSYYYFRRLLLAAAAWRGRVLLVNGILRRVNVVVAFVRMKMRVSISVTIYVGGIRLREVGA